jgi:hypothetical protein
MKRNKVRIAKYGALVSIPLIYPFVGFLMAPSLLWNIRDHRVWPWDQAWYGEVSVNLWFSLTHSLTVWARTMITGLNSKPPGIVWFGEMFVPLRTLLGSVEASLLLSIIVTQCVVLLLLFGIGRTMFPGSYLVPAAGVIFAASGQLFVGLSHQYFVEPLQCVAVAWVLLVAAKASVWPNARIAVHLIAALILGLSAKASTPVYCAAPCTYIALAVIRKGAFWEFSVEWRSRVSRALILLSGAFGALTAVWYVRNRGDVLQHVRDASSGAIAVRYGFRASPMVKLGAWTHLLEQSFGAPYLSWALLLVCVAVALSWLFRRTRGWPALSRQAEEIALVSAAQIAILLLTFSLSDTMEVRFVYALLPFIAVIVMWLCVLTASRKTTTAFCAFCALQWMLLHGVALGAVSHVANQSRWLLGVRDDDHDSTELMRVVRATGAAGKYNIVGVEEPWLNSNSATFFAAKDRLNGGAGGTYLPLGYAETDVKAALQRILGIPARYVITLDEPFQQTPPDFLNVVSLPVLREIRRDSQFKSLPFKSDRGLLVFERLESPTPWTILSTIFPQATMGSDGSGESWWRIHPSWRRAGNPTTLQYDPPLPPQAVFSGDIESCDKRCRGIEIVLNVTGPAGKHLILREPGPLEGQHIEAALENSGGQQLTVNVQSIDPERDNIDYCWLMIRGIQISSRPRKAAQLP